MTTILLLVLVSMVPVLFGASYLWGLQVQDNSIEIFVLLRPGVEVERFADSYDAKVIRSMSGERGPSLQATLPRNRLAFLADDPDVIVAVTTQE